MTDAPAASVTAPPCVPSLWPKRMASFFRMWGWGGAKAPSQPTDQQPSNSQSSGSAGVATAALLRWPADWAGTPFGSVKAADCRFPCVGAACAATDTWHAAGTLYFSEKEVVQRLWSGAVSKQILLCQRAGIPVIHHCCFPHLQEELSYLTDDYVDFHLDIEKHKDPAPDKAHAGPISHIKLTKLLMSKHQQIL